MTEETEEESSWAEWRYESIDEAAVKDIAMDLYKNDIFVSQQLIDAGQGDLMSMVFMASIFGGPEMVEAYEREGVEVLYEYYSEAGPRGINGYPMFFSHRVLDREDWNRVVDKWKKIKAAMDDV
jgi:hypothetical protein